MFLTNVHISQSTDNSTTEHWQFQRHTETKKQQQRMLCEYVYLLDKCTEKSVCCLKVWQRNCWLFKIVH